MKNFLITKFLQWKWGINVKLKDTCKQSFHLASSLGWGMKNAGRENCMKMHEFGKTKFYSLQLQWFHVSKKSIVNMSNIVGFFQYFYYSLWIVNWIYDTTRDLLIVSFMFFFFVFYAVYFWMDTKIWNEVFGTHPCTSKSQRQRNYNN